MLSPPPDIKDTIDKTASYVLKNGDSFENRLKSNPDAKIKFPFIFNNHEYYPYYQEKLGKTTKSTETNGKTSSTTKKFQSSKPPPSLHFLTEIPTISSHDLNVIKLTAIMVAKNGDAYGEKLHQHEIKQGRKAQFEFMNKTHSLYNVYTQFIMQYKQVLKIITEPSEFPDLFEDAYHRSLYSKANKVQEYTEKKDKEAKQLKYASIDWQDFTVVGKIEFDEIDKVTELSVALKREDLVYRSLEERTKTVVLEKVPEIKEDRDVSNAKNSTVKESSPPKDDSDNSKPTLPPGMKIRQAGESRLKQSSKEPTILCPITNKPIPQLKFDSHIRILLRDPNYQQQKQNYIDKNFKYSSNLTNDEVYENIKRLTRKRTNASDEESKRIKN